MYQKTKARIIVTIKYVLSILFVFLVNIVYADELMLGFYSFPVKSDIDIVAGSAFQYLMPYGTDNRKVAFLDDYLNYASKKGVKIIFSLKDIYRKSQWYPKIKWCPTDEESKLVSCIVKRFGNYESVHGWYLADEPTYTLGKKKRIKLERNARTIKKFSSKPIFVDDVPIPRGKLWEILSGISDIFMTNIYPIPEKSLHEVHTAIEELSVSYNRPVIAVLQVHGKYQYPFYKRNKTTGRPPTYKEIKVMSYLALIAGAKGIIYYSLFDIKKLPDSKQRWSFLKNLGEELKTNYQLINSRNKISKDYKLDKDDRVYALIRNYDGKDYFVGVNPGNIKKHVTISYLQDKSLIKKIELAPLDVKIITLGKSWEKGAKQ